MDAQGLPVRVLITPGTTTDGTQASKLIEGMDADHLIADKGYGTDAVLQQAATQGMHAVIPPKKNRTILKNV
ncbi:MAG: transposase [Candidatus Competibacteraceae bacterium]|nr:transposase [Candidatus Competibacteraceae bacterium]MCP5449375.1 transposase [Gammaproteobacteria bacterium]